MSRTEQRIYFSEKEPSVLWWRKPMYGFLIPETRQMPRLRFWLYSKLPSLQRYPYQQKEYDAEWLRRALETGQSLEDALKELYG